MDGMSQLKEVVRLGRLVVGAAALILSACSGGDGGNGGNGRDDDDADPTGIWTGTDARDGGNAVPTTVVVASTGPFTSISQVLYLSGSGSTDGNSFTATATGWAPAGTTFVNGQPSGTFSLSGTAFDRSTINGTYSGANESGTLTLSYDVTQSEKSVSITLIGGSYTTSGGHSLVVSNGQLTYNSSAGPNCVGTGNIRHDDPTRNVFTWSMTVSGCDLGNGNASGVGYLRDAAPGVDNRLTLAGLVGNSPMIINATK